MALANLSVPQYPNVPDLPGVPSLARDPLAAIATVASPRISGILGAFTPKWGIYSADGKTQELIPDTFLGLYYMNGSAVAQAPLENGSFTSYNKVATPFEGIAHMAIAGSTTDRGKFITKLEEMAADTVLYSVVTPEHVYRYCNLERYDMRRTQRNGAGMVEVRCHFKEIRQAVGTQYNNLSCVPESSRTNTTTSTGMPDPTNVKTPSAAAQVSRGIVAPQTPSTLIQAAGAAYLSSGTL